MEVLDKIKSMARRYRWACEQDREDAIQDAFIEYLKTGQLTNTKIRWSFIDTFRKAHPMGPRAARLLTTPDLKLTRKELHWKGDLAAMSHCQIEDWMVMTDETPESIYAYKETQEHSRKILSAPIKKLPRSMRLVLQTWMHHDPKTGAAMLGLTLSSYHSMGSTARKLLAQKIKKPYFHTA